ncbi:hypothetical protein V492_03018 [Pseudogymnoascus sp. VKM F-4246]|nr:hypothetical protein V492_03018 [Pseudogymnoascus sp. VKM F-4246]
MGILGPKLRRWLPWRRLVSRCHRASRSACPAAERRRVVGCTFVGALGDPGPARLAVATAGWAMSGREARVVVVGEAAGSSATSAVRRAPAAARSWDMGSVGGPGSEGGGLAAVVDIARTPSLGQRRYRGIVSRRRAGLPGGGRASDSARRKTS